MLWCRSSTFLGIALALFLGACQRPAGVPSQAHGSFTVLNGQRWSWRDHTAFGRIMWSASDYGLSLWVNAEPDSSSDPRAVHGPKVSYPPLRIASLEHIRRRDRWCEHVLTAAQADRVERIFTDALNRTSDPIRRRLLADAAIRVRQLDQSKLITDSSGFGCVIGNEG